MASETSPLPENHTSEEPPNKSIQNENENKAEDSVTVNGSALTDAVESDSAVEPSLSQEDKSTPKNEDLKDTSEGDEEQSLKQKVDGDKTKSSKSESSEPSGEKEAKEKDDDDEDIAPDCEKAYTEVAHWCRPCRVRIEPETDEAWATHAQLDSHKKSVVETKAKIAEKKKASGKTDDNDKEVEVDLVTIGQWCKICNWFVSPLLGWSHHIKDGRHKKNAAKAGKDVSKLYPPKKYTCVHCLEKFIYPDLCAHLAKDHVHKFLSPYEAKTPRVKGNTKNCTSTFRIALRMIMNSKDPILGLDFITEYQRKNNRQFFICDLCHNMLSPAPPLLLHLRGIKHKHNYWRCMANKQYELSKKMGVKGPTVRQVKALLRVHGHGKMNVLKGAKASPNAPLQVKDLFTNRAQKRSRDWNDDFRKSKRPFNDYENGPEMNPWIASNTMMPRTQDQFFPNMMDQFQYPPTAPNQLQFQNIPEAYIERGRDMTTMEKFKLIGRLFDFPISTKSQESAAANVLNTLKKKLLQYKIQNIPASVQDVLAKSLFGEEELHNFGGMQGMDPIDVGDYSGGTSSMNWGREGLLEPNMSSSRAYGSGNMMGNSGYHQMESYSEMRGSNSRQGGSKFYKPQQQLNRSGWRNRSQQSSRPVGRKSSFSKSGSAGKNRKPYN